MVPVGTTSGKRIRCRAACCSVDLRGKALVRPLNPKQTTAMESRATAFLNGHVFDGRRHLPRHGVLVREGRIVAVLAEADLRSRLDADPAGTDVVDLAGGVVLPGFQDAHVHPVQGGVERLRCDLTGLHSAEEYLRGIGAY